MTKTILCFCRDVTAEDVVRVVEEGYGELETVKRITGAFTGPCQGKTCLESIQRLVAELTGRRIEDVPAPPIRPPSTPVRLGTLAAKEQL
jgi:NAD(P)H-nitrite reductase large subunit